MVQWEWRSFEELSTNDVYEILALREAVFIVEQNCPYQDADFRDQASMHLLGKQDGKLIAYLRLLPEGLAYPDAVSIGRFCTSNEVRGQGLARQALHEVEMYGKRNNITKPLIISAQLYLKPFYESYGCVTLGEPYLEDGIMHIKMIRKSDHEASA